MAQDTPEGSNQQEGINPAPLSEQEEALLSDFRLCSPRRQEAVIRFCHKLTVLDHLPEILEIHTNILEFRRRRDD